MLKLVNKVARPSCLNRNITLFSPLPHTQYLPLVFPFHSSVIDDCGVTFSLNNNLNSPSSLKQSFIPFEGTTSNYKLTPKTHEVFDKKITDLANTMESIGGTFFKLMSLLGLKYTMEILPKLFSWQEYYAISEYTAIFLLNCGEADRAIRLIKRMPTIALHAYHSEIKYVDSRYLSVKELLILAHLIKGDYQQAEILVDRLIVSLQEYPIESYQARAMTIKALIHYAQGSYHESIALQEQAVKLLKGPGNTPLQAVAVYDLWVYHRMLNNNKQAEETLKVLAPLLKNMNQPLMKNIKSFIVEHIDNGPFEPLTKCQP